MNSEQPSVGKQWWANLEPATRAWLINNNGDAVPEAIAREVAAAGGPAATLTDADGGTPALYFPDEVTDWIEAAANDEEAGTTS